MELKKGKSKKFILLNTIIFSLVLFFVIVSPVKAAADPSLMASVAMVVGWIIYPIISFVGWLSTFIINTLLQVAGFSDIINAEPVVKGWVIVRDLCNMFFILILLVIAFATILKLENYNVKKLLPKLLIMAVLINFSKTICGLIIDFGQVIMLTFVNGFGAGAGNFVDTLGIKDFLRFSEDNKATEANSTTILASIIAALIFSIIVLITLIVILAVLVMRIIMLWVYVILSPLAFLASAFPAGQKYASQWWGEFSKQVVIGPVLAFFIWLTLSTAKGAGNLISPATECKSALLNSLMCNNTFTTFVISIGMLIGGLLVTQQMGGIAATIAGKGLDWTKRVAKNPVGARTLASSGIDKLHEKTGVDINIPRVWNNLQDYRKQEKAAMYARGQKKATEVMAEKGTIAGVLAMTGNVGDSWDQITSAKGIRQRILGGRRLATRREEQLPELEQAKFEEEFVRLNKEERRSVANNLTEESYQMEEKIGEEKDEQTKKELQNQKNILDNKLNFINSDDKVNKDFSAEEIKGYEEIRKIKQAKFDKNVPIYGFEARAAEQKSVNEKMARIKDVNDGSELLRILNEAIREKDKSMIKAISKKMAMQGDENDILMEHTGSNDARGLHQFMEKLQKEAEFGEQEAMELGADISTIAKGNNHWSVAGAYKMQNGLWKQATEKEQASYMGNEGAKVHTQKAVREFGRLAYGTHDKKGEFHISVGGVKILQNFDNAEGIKEISKNMQRSAAEWLAKDPNLQALQKQGLISEDLYKAIMERASSKAGEAAKLASHEEIKKALANN